MQFIRGGFTCIVMKNNQQVHRDEEVFDQVRVLLSSDLKKHYSIDELAQVTGMNRTKLCFGFKQLYGFSIHQYTILLRITFAKKLLSDGELQVKVVAQVCGYKTLQHFVTAFKKNTGLTPLEFQKKNIL